MWAKLTRVVGIVVALGAFFWACGAAAAELKEGTNYRRLQEPIPVETGNKIEVIEFFSYACPHCATFEPILEPWIKKLPADVQFRRVPAMFQPGWLELAKIYYTLETLGQADKLSRAVFNAVHVDNAQLKQDKAFFDWAAKQGLDRQKVADVYNSFTVNSKIARAKSQMQSYRIEGVPAMSIDGKFLVNGEMAGSYNAWLDIADALIAKARQERASKKS